MLRSPVELTMAFLMDLLETGKVAPVIDRSYPLTEVPEALRRLKEGDIQGKVVITMDHRDDAPSTQ